MARSALLNVMSSAVFKAGRALSRDFGEAQSIQAAMKGSMAFAQEARRNAESVLCAELEKKLSGSGFLTPLGGEREGSDSSRRWIAEPLGGAMNFMHAVPLFAISLALEREGELVAGIIYNPASDEFFSSERGQGAFLNDRRLRVSGRRELSDCLASPQLHADADDDLRRKEAELVEQAAGMRKIGCAALELAWLSAGRLDLVWRTGLAPWSMAAGICILREAGAMACDEKGNADMMDTGILLAANEAILPQLRKIVA